MYGKDVLEDSQQFGRQLPKLPIPATDYLIHSKEEMSRELI